MKELVIEKWEEIMEFLRTEYGIKEVSYNTWLKNMRVKDVVDNKVIIVNDDEGIESSISFIQSKYGRFIKNAIAEVTDFDLDFEIISEAPVAQNKAVPEIRNYTNNASDITLNSDYTFDNFVVSSNNSMVHAAALKVAEAPGQYYNPLYIYGDPGLGKTHLMHAIAHFIIENSPNLKVMYVTSNKFMTELIDAIRHGSVAPADFREKYRNIDVLLIDDIQFIIGKDSTQQEFFHTFNYLYDNKKQIVISSDKPPRDFNNLEDRLRSRFESGLIVDITAPDYEAKMAILNKKLEMKQLETGTRIDISNECLSYIANNINTNIRSLEGALTKVLAHSKINRVNIDLPLVEYALRDIVFPNQKKIITPEFIIDIVAEHFELSVAEILSPKRDKKIAVPRQIAIYLSRKYTNLSTTDIAKKFERDHTTVIHAISTIEKKLKEDVDIVNKVDILTKKLNIEE